MKVSLYIACGFVSLSLISCGSLNFFVPGEKKVVERNISEEYFSIAEAYKGQKNYSKAIEYYTLALNNKDLHDSAYYQIALCNVYNKRWASARKSFTKLLKRDPENVSLMMSLAYIEAVSGNLKKAEKMYEIICSERPDDSESLVNYINVLIADEKYFEAKEKLGFLESKFPDEANIDPLKKKISELVEDRTVPDGDGKKEALPQSSEETSKEELFGLNEEIKED